jgi:hypothetical protein
MALSACRDARVTPHAGATDEPTCETCAIRIEPIVRLGTISDSAGFGITASVAASRSGKYAVSSGTFPGQIQIYGPDGTFEVTVGKRGSGPGEFSGELLPAFDEQDSLHVIEQYGSRYSVFDAGLAHMRSVQLNTSVQRFCLERAGTLLAIAPLKEQRTISFIQIFSRAGESIQAFAPFAEDALDPRTMPQLVACDDQGGRWTTATPAYLIEKWASNGEREWRYEAEREWFPPARVAGTGDAAEEAEADPGASPPIPHLVGLTSDELGRLWVFVSVADSEWQPLTQGGEPDPQRSTDTIVELIDPGENSIIARGRFDESLLPLGTDRAYSIFEESSGDRRIQIWRLQLRNR